MAELYEQHGRHVLAWAERRVRPPAAAQDVLSETFLVCWRRLDDVPAGDGALPWLYAVARGVLANHRRGEGRRLRLVDRIQGERPLDAGADVRVERLGAAMTHLRPADAEILRLAAWEGLGATELAIAFDCTPNAASIRLHRAKQALLRAYEGLEDPA